jgi:hypothetical protein
MKWLLIVMVLLLPAVAGASLVTNGDFESPRVSTNQGSWIGETYVGGMTFEGWLVGGHSIDLLRSMPAAGGSQLVNLNGHTSGSIEQVLTLTPGDVYKLRFALSWNPDGADAVESVQVDLGSFSRTLTYTPGPTFAWTWYDCLVRPETANPLLRFSSLVPGFYGPLLDEVSLTPVPEPAVLPGGVLAAGLAAARRPRPRRAGRGGEARRPRTRST